MRFLLASFVVSAVMLGTLPSCTRASASPTKSVDEGYPSRSVHLIVPFPAGGGADFWGRLLASKMAEALRQRVVVDNVPGAGGNLGTAAAARAPTDGYTLLLGSTGPLAVHPFTYAALPFDAARDFAPVALLESSPMVLVVHPGVPASSLSELIALAKSRPGELTFASNGNGSPEQIAGALFEKRVGVNIRHVPFDGAGPARKELIAGGVTMMFDPCKAASPAIKQGKERALGLARGSRLRLLSGVPTFGEAGIPAFELRIWTGVLAPKGTSPEIVSILNRAIREAMATPDIRKATADQGSELGQTSPQEFSDFIDAERSRWKSLATESGVSSVR